MGVSRHVNPMKTAKATWSLVRVPFALFRQFRDLPPSTDCSLALQQSVVSGARQQQQGVQASSSDGST